MRTCAIIHPLHLELETALYLKEEPVSIASRYEQATSRAPSDVYVITDDDIRHSEATNIQSCSDAFQAWQ